MLSKSAANSSPKQTPAETIDEYISRFPKDVQKILQKIRLTIRKAAPQAKEAIKYQIPAFTLDGNLIFFAAHKKHVGIYPIPRGNKEFQKEIAAYRSGKGTVKFPLDKPIRLDLISHIAKFRVKESLEEAKARKKK